jgi:DNA-binding GntR family transcriptional regulator
MKLNKISTRTIRQQVYDQLRKKIITAEILPGQVMTLQGLAREFGVSMTPVREALWQLESEKIIVIESNKCVFVNSLKPKEMEELLEIRIILEGWLVEKACGRIPKSVLSKLSHVLGEMNSSFGNHRRWASLNSQFHFTIYSHAESPMLLGVIDPIWARVGPYLNMDWLNAEGFAFLMKCHWGLYKALVKKDGEKAKEWLCIDLRWAAKTIIPHLEASHLKETTVRKEDLQ